MIALLQPLIADLSNLPWVAIIAVAGGILLTIVIIVGGLIFAHRRQQLWHETARIALEKGQPLPQMLDEPAPQPTRENSNHKDIRSGLILIAVGAGLFLFLNILVGRGLGFVGAIPGFIGVALLLFGLLGPKNHPPSDQPRT